MSDVATFQFQTDLNLDNVREEVSKRWTGRGREVDIYTREDPTRAFCVLEYFFGKPDERQMLLDTAIYLLEINKGRHLYYYRCIDFVEGVACPPIKAVEIDIADLLLDDYQPAMGAYLEQKFVIKT